MTTAAPAVPVFGDDSDDDVPTTSFVLVSKARVNGKVEKRRHTLSAYAETDAGSLLTMLGGKADDSARQFRGMTGLLLRVLVDDDGVPTDAMPRLVDHDEPTDQPQLGDGDTSTEVATTDTVVSANAKWQLTWPNGDPADDTQFDNRPAAETHALEHGSSKRRFLDVIADPDQTVDVAALSQIVEHIASAAAGRPTVPSSGSAGSPNRRTRRART